MEYKNRFKDFINRTLFNLKYIEDAPKTPYEGPYEVTQLINSMVGLLIIPKEIISKENNSIKITDDLIDPDLLDRIKACIKSNTYTIPGDSNTPEPVNLQNIVKHFRNAVAHDKMSFNPEEKSTDSEIHFVKFTDKRGDNCAIEIVVPIDLLREFLLDFSSAIANLPENPS